MTTKSIGTFAGILALTPVAVGEVPQAIEHVTSEQKRTNVVLALNAAEATDEAPTARTCSADGGTIGTGLVLPVPSCPMLKNSVIYRVAMG